VSRWQGSWLVWAWLLLPGMAWGQEPLLIPRAQDAAPISSADAPLKLGRSPNAVRGAAPSSAKASSGWGTTLGSLLFVLAIVVVAGYAFSRHGTRLPGMLPADVVQVLGKRYVDSRNSLQLIRCGSKILVVANSTQHGLTTLAEITDPLEVEQITGQCLPGTASGTPLSGPHLGKLSRTTAGPTGTGGHRG
jgi:flagellar biogenesis protein FliO